MKNTFCITKGFSHFISFFTFVLGLYESEGLLIQLNPILWKDEKELV